MSAVSSAAASAPVRLPEERGPAALMPTWLARLVGFAALACLGAAQWQRMAAELGTARPLLWVALAVGAAALVLLCDRVPGRLRSVAMLGAVVVGLLAAYLAAGLDLALLKPRRLDELGSGLYSGSQALSTVQLPYDGADPWPRLVLQLLGAALVMVSALLAFWPRATGGRGYPFLALAALLVLVAAPVVSLGGARPLLLGAGLTLLTVCFLWLERLPLRPGLGVAALIGVALAGALPLAAAADRGEPWFDYQAFAEGLGPKDPVRFNWEHGDYGPIRWGRTGAEMARVKASRPQYWKVRTLDEFDGRAWESGAFDRDSEDPLLDLTPNWEDNARFEDVIEVSVQRLSGTDLLGAGTTLDVTESTREVDRAAGPGNWQSRGELRVGDSYRARVFVPRPTVEQLAAVPASPSTDQVDDLQVGVQLRELLPSEYDALPEDMPRSAIDGSPPSRATIEFQPFGREGVDPIASYRTYGQLGNGAAALEFTDLARTWELAQQLKAGTATPFEYTEAVSAYLRQGFTYTEKPPSPPLGVSPLEFFLFDSKAGYCQHYSAAMALLLRMGGVPARVATGFSPGGYSKRKEAWIVRDTDAHSWVEVWFDTWGWVTVDPTPAATPARSQIATLAPPALSEENGDETVAEQGGQEGAGGPADRRAAGEREALFERLRGGGGVDAEDDAAGGGGGPPVWLIVPVLLVAAGAGAFWLLRARRRRPDDPVDRAIAELVTALRRSGREPAGGMTLLELERRLGLSEDAAGYLRAVSAGRYAPRPVAPTNAQRRALRRELALGLGYAGRLRTFWALPPRAR
jgi:transglutaminase-like putative cysteine protease